MIQMKYEDIVSRIKTEKGLSENEIKVKIKEKLDKLSDLITKEGAAHIVANDLGVKLFDNLDNKKLKINQIFAGMRNIGVYGKILEINDVREFKNEKRQGRIGSFLIGDETGRIRVVLWDNSLIEMIEKKEIDNNKIVAIKGGYAKENNGFKELHLGDKSRIIINPDNIVINNIAEFKRSYNKVKISEISKNDFSVTIYGSVVQVFDPRFYEACPHCNRKVSLEGGIVKCVQHGKVSEKLVLILNMFLDDGSGNIRIVAFRDLAEKLFSMSTEEVNNIKDDVEKLGKIKGDLLGKQLVISGRVNKNDMFDRVELVAQEIKEADPSELILEYESKSLS